MTKRLEDNGIGVDAGVGRRRRRFWRDEDGSFIIFGLAIFMMMIYAGGLGVDVMRYEAHRTKVQNTLDRAILAAAALDQTLDPETVVLDYFARAGLGNIITADDIEWTASDTDRRVEASLNLRMGTTFLRMGNLQYFVFPAAGGAEEAASLSEISLVLDVSGSMGWASYTGNSKIYELKKAAKTFVNLMLCNPEGSDADGFDWTLEPDPADCTADWGKISMNVVPYAEQVLVGEDFLTRMQATAEHDKSSCVTFASSDFNSVALNVTPTLESERLQRTAHFDPVRGRNDNPSDSNAPCQDNSWREIAFLEDDYRDLFDEIDALQASGNTSIDIGLKWGAALLDDSLQDIANDLEEEELVFEGYGERPFSYDKRGIKKVIVLMTDGENTDQDYLKDGYHSGPSGVFYNPDDADRLSIYDPVAENYYWVWNGERHDHAYGDGEFEECVWVGFWIWGRYECSLVDEGDGAVELTFPGLWDNFTVSWYEQFAFTDDYVNQAYNYVDKNEHLDAMCQAAKDEGIIVFTIGFEVPGETQDDIMRDCASFPSYYYDVNGLNIQTAFESIAREISKLKLIY